MVWPPVLTSTSLPSGEKSTLHGDPDAGAITPMAGGPSGLTSHTRSFSDLSDAGQPVAVADELGVPGAALVSAQHQRVGA